MNLPRLLSGAPWAAPPLFVLASLTLAWLHGFHQHHNDYWDVYHAAARLAWDDRGMWFNGQYPIVYTVLTRGFITFGNPVVPAMTLNILLAGATVLLLARLCRGLMAPAWALFAVLALAAFPEFFRYANAAGGDPGAMLLFTAGGVLILRELLSSPERLRPDRLLFAGLLMGWAGLFRYHAFVGGALWAVALSAALPGRRKAGVLLAVGLCAGYAPQWIVNLLAGRGLFETGFGPMNVHHLMHGMNWQRISDLNVAGSSLDIIAADPGLFLRKYAASLWSFKQAWIPPLLAVPLALNPVHRRAFLALALWTAGYFALFSATSSGRQALLALPLSMFALGVSLQALWARAGILAPSSRLFTRAALAFFCAALLALHAARDARWLERRGEMRASAAAMEAALLAEGAARAGEVFTTDYDLYFAGLPGLVPRSNGGAVRLGSDWYDAAFPEFPADDLGEFVAASRARGVRFVVLDASARDLSPAMGALYAGDASSGALAPVATIGRHRVFRVE
jgi:hypothetical protein